MPRAAGMVKSTASQQQDTMRDMNRPKSWTAGIWQRRGGGGVGGVWRGQARGREPGTLQPQALRTPDRSQDEGVRRPRRTWGAPALGRRLWSIPTAVPGTGHAH